MKAEDFKDVIDMCQEFFVMGIRSTDKSFNGQTLEDVKNHRPDRSLDMTIPDAREKILDLWADALLEYLE